VAAVEAVLDDLAAGDEPLVRQLAREPGQKESRWIHLLGEGAESAAARPAAIGAFAPGSELEQRITELEERVARLETKLAERG
jgi:uncharacterized protein YceH (UPF0502 family)